MIEKIDFCMGKGAMIGGRDFFDSYKTRDL